MSDKLRFWAGLLIFCLVTFAPGSAAAQAFDTFEVVCTFHVSEGAPLGRLVQMPDGSLLGTTSVGGVYGGGTIFALEAGRSRRVLFRRASRLLGARRADSPLPGSPGPPTAICMARRYTAASTTTAPFFAPTQPGGSPSFTVFLDSTFPSRDIPSGGLLAASDGYLYGAATGGRDRPGRHFSREPRPERFRRCTTSTPPTAPDRTATSSSPADGYFYGTTFDGPGIESTIFRVNGAGDFASLHTLTSGRGQLDSRRPRRGRRRISTGRRRMGGRNFAGTVFKFTAGGTFHETP